MPAKLNLPVRPAFLQGPGRPRACTPDLVARLTFSGSFRLAAGPAGLVSRTLGAKPDRTCNTGHKLRRAWRVAADNLPSLPDLQVFAICRESSVGHTLPDSAGPGAGLWQLRAAVMTAGEIGSR